MLIFIIIKSDLLLFIIDSGVTNNVFQEAVFCTSNLANFRLALPFTASDKLLVGRL